MSVRYDLAEMEQEVNDLFLNLNDLATASDSFYSVDQVLPEDGKTYRIFLYRLASYSDFLLPGALESRGIVFREDAPGVWNLVCRPPEKFFNWNENPFTMNMDLTKIKYGMVKEDGSLISTYTDGTGALRLKTKGSLFSEQCVEAAKWLDSTEAVKLKNTMSSLEHVGWTINCEWTSPLNRVVVPYQTDRLIVLNARHRQSGVYMERVMLERHFGEFAVEVSTMQPHEVKDAVGTEGIVAFFGNDEAVRFMKVKADAYLVLHKLKDGVNQPNALFEAVIHDQIDDLRASFASDPAVQLMIQLMEDKVSKYYNHFVDIVDALWEDHVHITDRKTFAVTVQQKTKEHFPLDSGAAFSALMNRFLGRDPAVRDLFIRSAQARVVGEYKTQVVQALKDANLGASGVEA